MFIKGVIQMMKFLATLYSLLQYTKYLFDENSVLTTQATGLNSQNASVLKS